MSAPGVVAAPGTSALGALPAHWILPERDAGAVAQLAAATGLPAIIAELLLARGTRSAADADRFLNPALEHLLPPGSMHGMPEAVARVQLALARREPILIYGDYDVDGTVAIVLLKTTLEMLGGEVRFHVPHRIREGYGMQAEILTTAAAQGVRLVISVDTGIRAYAAAEEAERLGLDLIVTDHHLPEAGTPLPRALAILNPNQPACGYACKHLCGAAVVFKLAQALLEAHDAERARAKILPSFLKMAAIATVADAVPLLGENRVIASLGIAGLRRPVNAGLRALMQVAQLDPHERALTATDIAFRIAPRINAAGRMDVASDVVELFTTRDAVRARELAERLERHNSDRRQTEAGLLEQIERRLREEACFQNVRCIVIHGEEWHPGVIGILASRIVDRTALPALVISCQNGEARGSGRSIPGFHLLDAIEACSHLFTKFGGHAHAVGFSLPTDRVPALREHMTAWAAEHISADMAAHPPLPCDGKLPLDQITPAVYRELCRLAPFGMGNEEPVFVAPSLRVAAPVRTMKERHVRVQLADATGSASIAALGWDWAAPIAALGVSEGSVIHLAYRLKQNTHPEYGGALELEIADLVPAS